MDKAPLTKEELLKEYRSKTPSRILEAFQDSGSSSVRFRRDPETGALVIHTADRYAHAALQSHALRQEHDDGLLNFDVKAVKDHYRIEIQGDEKALERVYKSLQLLEKNRAGGRRFHEYGKPKEEAVAAEPQPVPAKAPARPATRLQTEKKSVTEPAALSRPKPAQAPASAPEEPPAILSPRTPRATKTPSPDILVPQSVPVQARTPSPRPVNIDETSRRTFLAAVTASLVTFVGGSIAGLFGLSRSAAAKPEFSLKGSTQDDSIKQLEVALAETKHSGVAKIIAEHIPDLPAFIKANGVDGSAKQISKAAEVLANYLNIFKQTGGTDRSLAQPLTNKINELNKYMPVLQAVQEKEPLVSAITEYAVANNIVKTGQGR